MKSNGFYVVVTAPGGGIHAAAWTAQVLTGLHEGRPDVMKELHCVSGVSGGSVGTMFYLQDWDRLLDVNKRLKATREIREHAQTSSLEAIGHGAAFYDPLWSMAPWVQQSRLSDSGKQMEKHWEGLLKRPDSLLGWGAKSNMPTVVFNATEVDTGQRVQFSSRMIKMTSEPNVTAPKHKVTAPAKNVLALYGPKYDIDVVTAVRMSATFPYVTPVARPSINAPEKLGKLGAIGDGGYSDNEGITTAAEVIMDLVEREKNPRILLLRIAHESEDLDEVKSDSSMLDWSGFLDPTLGPLQMMFNTRVASQSEHAGFDVEILRKYLELQGGELREVQIRYGKDLQTDRNNLNLKKNKKKMPLSWKLTPVERDSYSPEWIRQKVETFKAIDDFVRNSRRDSGC